MVQSTLDYRAGIGVFFFIFRRNICNKVLLVRVINKFSTFGEGVVAASLLVLECPDNTIHLGPAIKGLLPGIYKVANHKELPGIGMTAKLESKEGREALKDKDIKSITPVEKVEEKKGDKAAPAATGGGGDVMS